MSARELMLHEVLDSVNEERRDRHLPAINELPSGQRRNAVKCSLARALGQAGEHVSVGPVDYVICTRWLHCQHRPLSPLLRQFERMFDSGAFPELLEDDE